MVQKPGEVHGRDSAGAGDNARPVIIAEHHRLKRARIRGKRDDHRFTPMLGRVREWPPSREFLLHMAAKFSSPASGRGATGAPSQSS
jgi:hypothetical protein